MTRLIKAIVGYYKFSGEAIGNLGAPGSFEAMRLMHRFFSGVPIANEDRLRELLYPVTKEQLSYVCYRSTLVPVRGLSRRHRRGS